MAFSPVPFPFGIWLNGMGRDDDDRTEEKVGNTSKDRSGRQGHRPSLPASVLLPCTRMGQGMAGAKSGSFLSAAVIIV